MNVKRFTARTSRDALSLVRQALGDDAVVLSTKPCAEGVEVLAMAPESMRQIERMAAAAGVAAAPSRRPPRGAAQARSAPGRRREVQQDVEQLSMSTLSFQDYVRERMLKRRQAAMKAEAARRSRRRLSREMSRSTADAEPSRAAERAWPRATHARAGGCAAPRHAGAARRAPRASRAACAVAAPTVPPADAAEEAARAPTKQDMMNELRSMKGLIEERFGALAFMEKLQRQPAPGPPDAEAARLRLLAGADPQAGRRA